MINKIKVPRSVFPNTFTSLNALCGFASIVMASEGNFVYASWLILIAAVCDALDGMMARLTKSSSQFGVELDSLVDCVSFGAAPSFLIYKAHMYQYGFWGIVISSALLIFGAYRLARFNVELVGFSKDSFSGIPIPLQAITTASFVFCFYNGVDAMSDPYSTFTIPLIVLLSIMMVSKIKYPTLPGFSLESIKKNIYVLLYFLIAGIFVLIAGLDKVFFVLIVFIFIGIIKSIFDLIFKSSVPLEKNNLNEIN